MLVYNLIILIFFSYFKSPRFHYECLGHTPCDEMGQLSANIAPQLKCFVFTNSKQIPTSIFSSCCIYGNFLVIHLPTQVLRSLSPFDKLYGTPLDYLILSINECFNFPNLTPYTWHKLGSQSKHSIFIEYAPNYKGYRCLDRISNWVNVSRHV